MKNQKPKNANFKNVFFLLLICVAVTSGCTLDQTAQKDEFPTETNLSEPPPQMEQTDEPADTQITEEEVEITESISVTPEPTNTPESTNLPVVENSIYDETPESWIQIVGAEVVAIDPEYMILSVVLDESAEEVVDEAEIQTEEQTETTSEILQINVSQLVLSQNNVILDKDDSTIIVQEDEEVIDFDEIQENDFIVIHYEGIENNELLNVESVTKMLYETESEIEEAEIQEGDMAYLQGSISNIDINTNSIEYIYTYKESAESEEEFEDKATVKLLENGKIYQINEINEINNAENSQEVSLAELEIGQEIYIKTQSMDNETNLLIVLKL